MVRLGPLLASTFQRVPGIDGPMCRWILAYRQDFHGEVMTWLEDVLADARAGGKPADLPYDLRSPDRCQSWLCACWGSHALEGMWSRRPLVHSLPRLKPLALVGADGHPQFKWQIASEDAARLARSFAEQRQTNPDSPLTPQLQVVLARLLAEATAEPDGVSACRCPREPDTLNWDALDAHLRRGLEEAFPATRDGKASAAQTKGAAGWELGDASGRARRMSPESTLKAALGENGEQDHRKLAAPP